MHPWERLKARYPWLCFFVLLPISVLDWISRGKMIAGFLLLHPSLSHLISSHIFVWIGFLFACIGTFGFFQPISYFEFLPMSLEPYCGTTACVVPIRAKGKKSYSYLTGSIEFRHIETGKVVSVIEATWLENRDGFVTMVPSSVRRLVLTTSGQGFVWAAAIPPETYQPRTMSSISQDTLNMVFDRSTGIRVQPLDKGVWKVAITLHTGEGKSYKHETGLGVGDNGVVAPGA